MPRVTPIVVALFVVSACSAGSRIDENRKQPATAASVKPLSRPAAQVDIWSLRFVGMDEGMVPPFRLQTAREQVVDSTTLVGSRPFAILFFATWCGVCDLKLDALRAALARYSDFTVIGVSVDDESTWRNVPGYLREHGVDMPVASALEHPTFTLSYNPFGTVPLLVVVGRNGGLVDYQLGYEADDVQKVMASLELAKTIGPLANPPASTAPGG